MQLEQQLPRRFTLIWEIQRERRSRHGEGHQPGGDLPAKALQNREERALPARRDGFEHLRNARARFAPGHHTLELEKSAPAVQAVPAADRIQWIEPILIVNGSDPGAV